MGQMQGSEKSANGGKKGKRKGKTSGKAQIRAEHGMKRWPYNHVSSIKISRKDGKTAAQCEILESGFQSKRKSIPATGEKKDTERHTCIDFEQRLLATVVAPDERGAPQAGSVNGYLREMRLLCLEKQSQTEKVTQQTTTLIEKINGDGGMEG